MKAFLNWSGGKDSALALHVAQQTNIPVAALVTTINASSKRVTMHGVPIALIKLQARALGLPLHVIELPVQPSMQVYETAISQSNAMLKKEGFSHAVSGDLFLEDLKSYRQQLYAKDGLQSIFPLWKVPPNTLLQTFFSEGFKAVVVCVNGAVLHKNLCGAVLNSKFISSLPTGVDICGENGEYHSFVFDGPGFTAPVAFTKGKVHLQTYPPVKTSKEPTPVGMPFYFCELQDFN